MSGKQERRFRRLARRAFDRRLRQLSSGPLVDRIRFGWRLVRGKA